MRKIKVLEIGASSLLDFDYNEHDLIKDQVDLRWIKSYRINRPQYHSGLVNIRDVSTDNSGFRRELINVDTVIYSVGNKGPRKPFDEYTQEEFDDIYLANLGIILETLPRVIKQSRISYKPIKVIFMGSIAGKEGNTYPNHAMYASMKAALRSLVSNLENEYDGDRKIKFHHLEIPYTASRMTEGKGESPNKLRNELLNIILK